MSRWNRGSRDHHLHHRQDAELNLIPLIDILSVMVAFLLVYSANVEVVQNSKGVEIPQSTADSQPKQSVVVMITRIRCSFRAKWSRPSRKSAIPEHS
jgi:biopolymer transport protein ExbD